MRMAPPKTEHIVPPLFRIVVFENQLAWTNSDPGGDEPGFDGFQIGRLPKAEVERIIGLIITVMEID